MDRVNRADAASQVAAARSQGHEGTGRTAKVFVNIAALPFLMTAVEHGSDRLTCDAEERLAVMVVEVEHVQSDRALAVRMSMRLRM
jgi:hypothetical protein